MIIVQKDGNIIEKDFTVYNLHYMKIGKTSVAYFNNPIEKKPEILGKVTRGPNPTLKYNPVDTELDVESIEGKLLAKATKRMNKEVSK